MALTRRSFISGLITATAGAWLAGPVAALDGEATRLSGRAFGTTWQLLLSGSGDARALARDIAALLERVDRSMSPFRAESAISRFNAAPAGRHDFDPDLAIVTAEALRIAWRTGGAFDPSVGPDVGRFGFGPIHGERVGTYADFHVAGTAVEKADPRLTLDLCGIAKGYALDGMAATAEAAGYRHFVAEIGGEVVCRGSDAGQQPWRTGISDPLGHGLYAMVDTRGLALATSGDAVNAYEAGGRRYSHIIDPRTDAPVAAGVASVSVLAETGIRADALATALMVMGPEAGIALAEAEGLAVLFLLRRTGGLEAAASRAFDTHLLS